MSGSSPCNPPFDSLGGEQFTLSPLTLRLSPWRHLLNASLGPMLVLDDDGSILEANEAACELFVYSRAAMLKCSINAVTEPGFDFADIQQTLQDQGRVRGSFCVVCGSGEIREVDYGITYQALEHCHILALKDISQEKQAQQQVKQLQKQLSDQGQLHQRKLTKLQSKLDLTERLASRATVDESTLSPSQLSDLKEILRHVPGAVYQFRMRPDGSYHFPYASDGLLDLYGVTAQDLQEDASLAFAAVHPADVATIHTLTLKSKETLIPWCCEYRILKPDGTIIWVVGHATPKWGDDGSMTWYGYLRDITRQKELESYQSRLLAILESTSDFIGTADAAGNILYLNRTWQNLYGDLSKIPKRLEDNHPAWALDLILQEGLPEARRLGLWQGETAILTADGEEIPVEQLIMHHVGETEDDGYFSTIIRDIRDRRCKELELQTLAQQLQEAQKLGRLGDWSFDVKTQQITWSDEVFRIFGMNPHEGEPTVEENFLKIHPDDRDYFLDRIAQAKQGIVQDFDIRILRANGDFAYINSRIRPKFEGNNLIKFVGIAIDITDRKRIEEELRQGEKKTRDLLNAIPDMMFRYSPDGVFLDYKPSADVTAYWKSSDFIGKGIDEIFPGDFANEVKEMIDITLKTGEPQLFEYQLPVPGVKQYFEARFIKANESEVLSLVRDISDRKRAEQERQELLVRTQILNSISLEIRNSLELEIILESAVVAIFNELELELCCFGWSCGDEGRIWQVIKEKKADDLASFIGEYSLENFPKVYEALKQNQVYAINSIQDSDDVSLKRLFDGSPIKSYCTIPIHTRGGRLGGFHLAYARETEDWSDDDIWLLQEIANQVAIAIQQADLYQEAQSKSEELSQAYRQLQDTQTQLLQAEKMSSLGQLVGGIAHEINNPVSFIYGNLNYAAEYSEGLIELHRRYCQLYPEPVPEILEYCDAIDLEFLVDDFPKIIQSMQYGATRIRDIVKSLRTFSRLDESNVKEVELHENLDSTLVLLQNRLNHGHSTREIDVIKHYGNLPQISCCSGLLNQVFMNLLMNAIDAIEVRRQHQDSSLNGDYQGQIRITTAVLSPHWIQISIRDNGCGMTPATQDKIFNPFFTTKPIGQGTGMGLPTSYQIITQSHQGKLYCNSSVNQGTEFIIELPTKVDVTSRTQT